MSARDRAERPRWRPRLEMPLRGDQAGVAGWASEEVEERRIRPLPVRSRIIRLVKIETSVQQVARDAEPDRDTPRAQHVSPERP